MLNKLPCSTYRTKRPSSLSLTSWHYWLVALPFCQQKALCQWPHCHLHWQRCCRNRQSNFPTDSWLGVQRQLRLLVWACAFFSKCCWQPVTWWQVRSWPETWDIDRNQRCAELTLSWRLPDVMWGRMQPDEIPSCENRVSVIVQWLCMRCKQTQTIRNTSWKDVSLC